MNERYCYYCEIKLKRLIHKTLAYHLRKRFCNRYCAIKYQYKNGLRDPKKNTQKANELVRKNGLPKMIGNKNGKGWNPTKEQRDKVRKSKLGKRLSIKTRNNMSISRLKYFGDMVRKSPENEIIRKSFKYRVWRESIFKRDNYTCIECGARSSKGIPVTLNADHIKPFAFFPELRFDINNGRTLCEPCHKKTDTWGRKVLNYQYARNSL